MRDEVKRIMQLVKDGKLSPDDAADLLEAFQDAPTEDPEPVEFTSTENGHSEKKEDPFSKLIGSIEKIGKDVAESVNWQDVADQVKQGVSKGVDALKQAAEDASEGKGPFSGVFGSKVARHVELPLDIPQGKTFMIDGNVGNVVIEGGHDIGSVKIDAQFRAYNQEEAEKMSQRYMPVLEERDNQIVLRHSDSSGLTTHLKVLLPTGTPVDVRMTSGRMEAKDTGSSVKVSNTSGEVTILRAKDSINIETVSGNVSIAGFEGTKMDVETRSGGISVDESKAPMSLKTSSGSIRIVRSVSNELSADSASGNVDADLTEPVDGSVDLKTVSGSVGLSVPQGSDASIVLTTLRGQVTCSADLTDEMISSMKVTGVLGSGKGKIEASTVNGHVSFTNRVAAAP